jgi:hypothetical protein
MLKQYTDYSILSVSPKTKLLAALSIISLVFLKVGSVALYGDIEYLYSVRPKRLKSP